MIRPGQARGPFVGVTAGGSAAALTDIPTWIQFDFTVAQLAAPAFNTAIALYSLEAGGMISGAKMKHTTLFTGPGSLSANASFGIGWYGTAFNDNNNGRFTLYAKTSGTAFNTKTIQITNTVLAGAETVTWAANTLVIQVQAGVSTVAQVLAAVAVGAAWADLESSTPGAVDALGVTAMSALPGYVAGIAGDLERIMALSDVQQAVADTTLFVSNIQDCINQGAATQLTIQLQTTGAYLDTLTQGALSVWLLLSKAV